MRRLGLLVFMVASACTAITDPIIVCVDDRDCPSGTLCFAEGCGDPGSGIVVEVQGPALSSHRSRDFALADGTLGASQNFELGAALSVSGQLQRERTAGNTTDVTPFTSAVVIRAVGESSLIPGVTRTFETRFDRPEFGFFEMSMGEGTFSISATPVDATIPPVVVRKAQVQAGMRSSAIFAFPAVDGAAALSGRLIRAFDANHEPVLYSQPFVAANKSVPGVELQLFDGTTNEPLSQRFPVSATSGEFATAISPEARLQARLTLVASPGTPGAPIPTKRFLLDSPLPSAISLEFGDYGEAGLLTGQVIDRKGVAVVGAHVLVEGTVAGDGTFRSKIVQTDAEGEFSVITLASRSSGSFQVTIVPPENSTAAATTQAITVAVTSELVPEQTMKALPTEFGDYGPLRVATLNAGQSNPSRIVLEQRLKVVGTVTQPGSENRAAVAVRVRAALQLEQPSLTNSTPALALPIEPTETLTDADGNFLLALDSGMWRLEFLSTDGQVPMTSRLVEVKQFLDEKGFPQPQVDVAPVKLSFGRTITGSVTGLRGGGTTSQGLPFSELRFFRVAPRGGKKVSILLGSAIADEAGQYRVVLPATSMDSSPRAGSQGP